MMLQMKKNQEKILNVVDILRKKGCNESDAFSLLLANIELLKLTENEIDKKISIIFNHNEIYAALFCDHNDYKWALYKDGSFSNFITYDPAKNTQDYIVELILSFVDSPKIKKIVSFEDQDNLEEKISIFKEVNTNDQGYHIR